MADSAAVALVRDAWDRLNHGGVAAVLPLLTSDARWRAVEDGPWNCESRAAIAAFFAARGDLAPSGRLETAIDVEGRVVVGFRPDQPPDDGWPLDGGLRYVVVSVAGGRISELKGCAGRQVARAYAENPTAPPPPPG